MKYQVKSCLDEIILVDKEYRDETFENVTGERQNDTSKKDFKKVKIDSELQTKQGEPLKQKLSEQYIFSIRSAKDTLERCDHFVSWLKVNYPEVKKTRSALQCFLQHRYLEIALAANHRFEHRSMKGILLTN